ncbi:MAG: AbrB/MazE/SpoVT family DNA-binding domain-containing protein, partial [Chloroflexi bacterium]|nr:AbrB/MazE/SpoVT family DNA-binding domain-containing protein [Chloroflexota bacterium]
IDGAGRVVLPKPLRDRFRLKAGSRLELEVRADHVVLTPVVERPPLVKEKGWWVYQGQAESAAALEDAVRAHREDRLLDLGR